MIESPLLKNTAGCIDGRWVQARSGESIDVIDPATGTVLARVPRMGAEEATEAVDAAAQAFEDAPSTGERRDWLVRIESLLLEKKDELARIITLEQGKPLSEAVAEVEYTAGFFRFFGGALDELEPRVLDEAIRGCRWSVYLRPAGVVASITPWNFPLAMMGKKVAPALAAGCCVVQKPAELTPLSAMAFFEIAREAGVPAGRLHLVLGDAPAIGEVLTSHPAVRVLSFTGSTTVGKLLAAQAAPHVKRLAMELGGNAPFIVFQDTDLTFAADELIANKFRAGGQTCVCSNRVYVHREVEDAFIRLVVERVAQLRVGNGLEPGIDVGPLIHADGFDKVARHVRDAIERGAHRIVGDDPPRPAAAWGAFYPPTVLTGIRPEMRVCREETFGPVVAIATFTDEDRVVAEANGGPAGLAAYVFTRDADRAARIIPRLRFGHVGWNTGTGPAPATPFGGMKQSGFGREGGLEGLLEFCEPQVVAERQSRSKP